MPAVELTEWMAYYEIDSLVRGELRAGKSPEAALEMVREIVAIHDEIDDG